MSRCKQIIVLFVLFLALTVGGRAGKAEAKVYLDVYGQSYKKATIAVPPFTSEEGQRSDISDLLGQDLDISGFFVVAPRSIMDQEFLSEGVDRKSIRFEQWRSLGVELLCKAIVREQENAFSLEAYLDDTGDGGLVFGKRYGGVAPSEWRRVVHRLRRRYRNGGHRREGHHSFHGCMSGRAGATRTSTCRPDGYECAELTDHNQAPWSPLQYPPTARTPPLRLTREASPAST